MVRIDAPNWNCLLFNAVLSLCRKSLLPIHQEAATCSLRADLGIIMAFEAAVMKHRSDSVFTLSLHLLLRLFEFPPLCLFSFQFVFTFLKYVYSSKRSRCQWVSDFVSVCVCVCACLCVCVYDNFLHLSVLLECRRFNGIQRVISRGAAPFSPLV